MIGRAPVECLYELAGPCRTISDVAGFFGAAAYDGRLLWASSIVLSSAFFAAVTVRQFAATLKIVAEFEQSLKKYPPIAPGTPDPYTPLK
jgi:hypothetical protein